MSIDWLNTSLVSVSMAVDCMTVGACDGVQEQDMKKRKLFFIAAVFGLMQGLMPMIGYFIGLSFRAYIESYIPWIAFSLLLLLGVKNICEWGVDLYKRKRGKAEVQERKKLSIKEILIQGLATSIDALSIGFVYLDYEVSSALLVFLTIALVTFSLSCLTIFFGKKIGKYLEKWAGLIAGIAFISIGLKILLEGIL